MAGLVELVGRLLSWLHGSIRTEVCPGSWPWTVTVAGLLFGLLPMLAAVTAAVIRHWTGNRYGLGSTLLFGVLGVGMVGLLPLAAFGATTEVFRRAVRGESAGLGDRDVASLGQALCLDIPQAEYLTAVPSVQAALFDGPTLRRLAAAALLVGLPLLVWLFVYIQARVAFRRGPAWPARFYWLPVLGLVLGTAPMSATVVAHAWLGFLPATIFGIFGVLLVGAPRWSVINSSGRRDPASPPGYTATPGYAASSGQPPPPGYAPPGGYPPPRPQPPPARPPQPRPLPPTLVGPGSQLLLAGGPPVLPARPLAADPGPLPATLQAALAREQASAAERTDPTSEQTAMLPTSRFQRIRRLGSGGFGQVWLAMDTTLGRTVAVKVATAQNAETEQRIQREARALAAVHHPNCVRIYDIIDDLDGGGLAIVMEYVPGRSLAEHIREARQTDQQAARLWHTLAGALHAAHGKGLLHRDVKPSNIIIGADGEPRLIDFGIARATGDVTLTAAGLVVGTPDFLPPEIAAGRPAEPASDAWQLAAAISFALTGAPPRGHADGAVAAMLAAARGEPCNQLPANSAHRGLLERVLHPDPAQRPTLPAVQTELASWLR